MVYTRAIMITLFIKLETNMKKYIYIEDMKYLLLTYIWIIDCFKYIIDFGDYGVYIVLFNLRFINVNHDCRVSL